MKLHHACSSIALRALIAAGACALAITFAAFDEYRTPGPDELRRVSTAVVFTGQFERIDVALKMLARGDVRRLFISGVNAGAGLSTGSFVRQFSDRNSNIEDLRTLTDCCITWGTDAETTIQNADETKCWLASAIDTGPILLISGRQHLARASLALRAAGIRQEILPYPVEEAADPQNGFRKRSLEFVKLVRLAMAAITPGYHSSVSLHGRFAAGCPEHP